MAKIKKNSTAGWSYDEWQAWRKKVITFGGSDASPILGLNPFKSAYALWAEKTGKLVPEDISDREAVRLGNDLEQYVAERWMESTGRKLRRENAILYNPDYPWAHANIDRAVVGEADAGFEAKTTGSFDVIAKLKAGSIPDSWYCQCCHYMLLTGARRWYLGALALGVGFFHFMLVRTDNADAQDYHFQQIPNATVIMVQEGELEALAAAERDFWELVQTGKEPPVDGSDATLNALKQLHAESDGSSCDLTGYAADLRIYTETGKQIKELEGRQKAAEARIRQAMGNSESGRASGFKVSYRTQSRSTFDRKKYEQYNGQIPAEFFKTSTTRPFKVSEI